MSKDQYDLYGGHPPHVRQITSFEAASRIKEKALPLREVVFGYIASRGIAGATDDEIEQALEMRHQTASARRRELVLKGRVLDGGERRPTRSGSRAIVWVRCS